MSDRGSAVEGSSYSNFAGIFLFVVVCSTSSTASSCSGARSTSTTPAWSFSNLQTWGWAVLVIGVVQVLAGWLVLSRSSVGRWVGIVIVIISMMVSFVAIGAYPFWTLIILVIDAMVLWGLTGRWEA